MTAPEVLAKIAKLQDIQKCHRPDSPAWRTASDMLAPLFAEMAARQRENGGK